MTTTLMAVENTGGIPVDTDAPDGSLVVQPMQLQYGAMLLGSGTPAGWRELAGWRDSPDGEAADSPRPQAHGAYPGDVFGSSIVATFTYLLRGTPEDKVAALAAIERYAPMDGVERVLCVDDGDGPWFRMARLIGRHVPQDKHFRHGPLECSLQFLCADPRRYSLTQHTGTVTLPMASGGLQYPLDYPLQYGSAASGALTVTNAGSSPAPLVATFQGPLTNPTLTADDWSVGFNLTLAAGEYLVVDTSAGTALLNGTADRLYTITNQSDPLERCLLAPGDTSLTLAAPSGQGQLQVSYRDARM